MKNSTLSRGKQFYSVSHSGSIFKLPAIFALIMIAMLVVLNIIYYSLNSDSNNHVYLFLLFNNLSNYALNHVIFYFFIGIIMFIDQKMHQITARNIIIILAVCIIYQVITHFIMIGWMQLIPLLKFKFDLSYDVISQLLTIFSVLLMALKALILVGLIKLIGFIDKRDRQAYNMPLANHRTLFAILFSLIFSFPFIIILFTWFNGEVFSFFMGYFDFFYEAANLDSVELFLIITLPGLLSLLSFAISFAFIFFSVKNCFVRQVNTIPLRLIFKAVGWSYLYLILIAMATGIIYFILSIIITLIMTSGVASVLTTLISIIFIVINLIATYLLTRKATLKYFS
ncbi:hypothetical protein RHO12_00390 [Orbus sturtevantii]|uniref:hypothetical protein n=1 Tax=Orbus sturtevantii TaxID=3074109 RepID=UPI00370DC69B